MIEGPAGLLKWFFFYLYLQADEESRRNQLMRDMAQLRLQVILCWGVGQRGWGRGRQ